MQIACGNCGIIQDEGMLVCAACGGFVNKLRMNDLQQQARAFELSGNRAEAIRAWGQLLALLPPDARQRPAVEGELRRLQGANAVIAPAPIAPTPTGAQGKRGLLGTAGAMVMIALSKAKLLLLGLTKFKTVASMVVMAAIYTSFYGWTFAVGIVLLIYVHEMGHMIAIRARGLDSSWPVFIPFVGAFVRLNTNPRNAAEDAYIGYAGPLLGSIAAVAVWGLGAQLESPKLVALAFFGFYINFFNLIAIPPLDGGRVTNALDRITWLAILPPLGLAAWWNPDGMVVIVTVVAMVRGLSVIFRRASTAQFDRLGTRDRWTAAVAYGGLAILLIAGMKVTKPHHDPAPTHHDDGESTSSL